LRHWNTFPLFGALFAQKGWNIQPNFFQFTISGEKGKRGIHMKSKKKTHIFLYIVSAYLVLFLCTGNYIRIGALATSSRYDWKLPTAFDIAYYAGLALCGVQGAQSACMASASWAVTLLLSVLSAFGGGLTRDVLLQVHPAVLTQSSLPGLCTAIGFSLYFSGTSPQTKAGFRKLFPIIDAFSLGTFIAYGVEAAQTVQAPPLVTVFCGVVTALGGGILCSLLCGIPAQYILSDALLYRGIVLLGSLLYPACLDILNEQTAHHAIIFYTGTAVLATNQEMRRHIARAIKHPVVPVRFALSYTEFVCVLIAICGIHNTPFFHRVNLRADAVHQTEQTSSADCKRRTFPAANQINKADP